MGDLTRLNDAEAAALFEQYAGELDAHVTAAEILSDVATGRAVIVRWPEAIAVVHPENDAAEQYQCHLWLLWVSPTARGRGIGRRFVRHIIREHAPTRYATVNCFGARRRAFFGRCGFRVVITDEVTGHREMEQYR